MRGMGPLEKNGAVQLTGEGTETGTRD
jgi:hypothetical protein